MYNENFVNQQIASIQKKDAVAIELGANHGMHTKRIAEKFSKVYAFEPHPDNIKILASHTAAFPNIEIVEAAITPRSGDIRLYNCPNPGGHTINTGVMEHRVWGHDPDSYHTVRGITLDDFCRERGIHPSFIKVDIEGAENTIFEGAVETLKNGKMDIIIEVHRFVELEKLYNFFKDLGYTIFDIDGIGRPDKFESDNHYIITNRISTNVDEKQG